MSEREFIVEDLDRLRVKTWNSAGTGQDYQAKMVIRFKRAAGGLIQTCTKILTPSNTRASAGFGQDGHSFPFSAGVYGRTVPDGVTTAGSGTISSATAVFTSADVGKAVEIPGAAIAGLAGPSFPPLPYLLGQAVYQGNIVMILSPTSAIVAPPCQVTTTGSTIRIEPVLLSDYDGLPLGPGSVVGLCLNYWQTVSRHGESFFEVEINRGEFSVHYGHTLIQNYLTISHHLEIGSPLDHHVSGPGNLKYILGTDPIAGTECVDVVPPNARWELQSWRGQLNAAPGGSNRQVIWRVMNGSDVIWEWTSQSVQPPNTNQVYFAGPTPDRAAVLARHALCFPKGMQLFQGWSIVTLTNFFAAGDKWQRPVIARKEWIED